MTRDFKEIDFDETDGAIKNAFVTFRSMEGAARMEAAFNVGILKRLFFKCMPSCLLCGAKERYEKKLFHGKWLKVTRSIEPSLILWHNIGVSKA